MRPPVEDSATTIVSLRSFRRRPACSARSIRVCIGVQVLLLYQRNLMIFLRLIRLLTPWRKLRLELEKSKAERDAYLLQRDQAIGERNAYLLQRDQAMGERNEYLRQRDVAI